MKKQPLIRNYLVDLIFMNNISDKYVLIIILITIFFVFGLIFTVKSPERNVIESPIIWKEDFSNISNLEKNKIFYKYIYI